MRVLKRSGAYEDVAFDKIQRRLRKLCDMAPVLGSVDVSEITARVCSAVHDGITTKRLDELTADVAQGLAIDDPANGDLAARILVSNLHKNTCGGVLDAFERLVGVLSPAFLECARRHAAFLESLVDYSRDYAFDYFGIKTLEKMYLSRDPSGRVIERPQHMFLRVAMAIWGDDLEQVRDTYEQLSAKKFTHASPTLFNAGTTNQALNSCYLKSIEGDSIESIFDALKDCALISKHGGGIGMSVSGIRSRGSRIHGTNGTSDGLVPMLRVVNNVALYVNQSARRKGAIAIYIEPHHPDFMDVLELKRNSGDEHLRARDLFYAAWISDLFMERVEADATWSFLDPSECPGLDDVHGAAYRALYERYEAEGKFVRQAKARDVWFAVLRSQMETGTPYVLYKDAANAKSNQQNLGTIKCSNLCVSGDTRILTDTGYHPIASLAGTSVRVWNGEQFSEVDVLQTGDDQELVTVVLDNGTELECTPYHKFYVDTESRVVEVEASRLNEGDMLVAFDLPETPPECDPNTPICGVPINAPPPEKLRWFERYVEDNDGTMIHCDGSKSLRANGTDRETMQDIKLMLQTLGVFSTVHAPDASYADDPWVLEIGQPDFERLVTLGFVAPDRVWAPKIRLRTGRRRVRVVDVENRGKRGPTYCFNEPLRHAGVFEGVLTGQCSEIIEFTSADEVSVCTLASVSLPAFVRDNAFDFTDFMRTVRRMTRNLDRVIDVTFYPTESARRSNARHRPIGIGVQGLQDVFFDLRLPFDSPEAAALNRRIFEALYFAAVDASCDLARDLGPYESYEGSPASQGRLQFDLWGVAPSDDHDWAGLKTRIARHGLRNSLLVAPMPTASTAQLLGNTEAFEPITSNIYSRRTLAGEFAVVNRSLVRDLMREGLWTAELRNQMVTNEGSANVPGVPRHLRDLYKTAWELSMKTLIDMAADRGPFVCQSQSLNMFVADPTFSKLSSMHFYAWKRGLKTGMYYLRTKPAARAVQVTVDPPACVACSG